MITHVFTDKTGTLTCNKMEFKGAAVGGKLYASTDVSPSTTLPDEDSNDKVKREPSYSCWPPPPKFSGVLPCSDELVSMMRKALAKEGRGSSNTLHEFLFALAINHTCERAQPPAMPDPEYHTDPDEGKSGGCLSEALKKAKGRMKGRAKLDIYAVREDGDVVASDDDVVVDDDRRKSEGGIEAVYQGTSPDESALVSAAGYFGLRFTDRTPDSIDITLLPEGDTKTMDLLHVVEFTSERRMMSVVVADSSIPSKEEGCVCWTPHHDDPIIRYPG